ncbi:MAG TPA: Crp/Fnr family transcriptional regulator [Polyangiaceae bacterium]|nr:Crp/Fnr family transcriptional regulator [Polyangiaceae bacterium]
MDTRKVLRRTAAFSHLEAPLLDRLAQAAVTRTLPRDRRVWCAGDQALGLTVLRSGLLKVLRPLTKGRHALLGLYGAPGTAGDLTVLRGAPYPTTAIVATPSATIIDIPRQAALAAIEHSPRFALDLIAAVEENISMLHDKIDVLSAGPVEARLATLLLKLYDRFGDDYDDGSSRVPIALTRQELADLIATSFETAIRWMTRWEREGLVSTDRGGFTVHDLASLQQIAGVTGPAVSAAAE